MTSGSANRGNYVFAIPNCAIASGCNFQVNQQFGMQPANIQGYQGYPVNMPVANVYPNYPMFQNFQIPSNLVQATPVQVQELSSMPPPRIPIYQMDVHELATWIRDFAKFKHWSEADQYANSFRAKRIDGKKLIGMDNNQLWMQLQIAKLGHRLEILRAVRELRSIRSRCADAMERYHRSYSDSEKSVVSTDHLPCSDQEPQRRRSRKLKGNFRRYGLESDRKACSDVDQYFEPSPSPMYGGIVTPVETPRLLKLAPKGGGKPHSNRASNVYEGETSSNDIVKNQKITTEGHGSDNVQQEKINNSSKVDVPVEKEKPFINLDLPTWDDPMKMNKGRKSTTVTTPIEELTGSNDNAGYQFEENKNEGREKCWLLSE